MSIRLWGWVFEDMRLQAMNKGILINIGILWYNMVLFYERKINLILTDKRAIDLYSIDVNSVGKVLFNERC